MADYDLFLDAASGFCFDWQMINLPPRFCEEKAGDIAFSLANMQDIEQGKTVNIDEGRMVGHYWLRNPALAPNPQIKQDIEENLSAIKDFIKQVHHGKIVGSNGQKFEQALILGIGGSSLPIQLVSTALSCQNQPIKLFFIDNCDPAGIDDILGQIAPKLGATLIIVISKSGNTVETNLAMEAAIAFWAQNGLDFWPNALCITAPNSKLADIAKGKWRAVFPLWDWVGGRSSLLAAVGLLPLGLQGIDIDLLLSGAAAADNLSAPDLALAQNGDYRQNPALMMALCWLYLSGGQGGSSLIIWPYKDRLALLAKYLQQLIMESLGKEYDLAGHKVRQGLAVYGNKGSSDQHSFLQQILDGSDRLLVNFIIVMQDNISFFKPKQAAVLPAKSDDIALEAGTYLKAFWLGTEQALAAKNKPSLSITIPELNAFYLGFLIAFYERAVGYYAGLIRVNAYHQPAVESGKKSAEQIIKLKEQLYLYLKEHDGQYFTGHQLAKACAADLRQTAYLLEHLQANHLLNCQKAADFYNHKYAYKEDINLD